MSRWTSGRRLAALALLVVLLIAGGLSFYASSSPDGLASVAGETGFASVQRDSATADGPLAGYETKGVEDPRISRGVAGLGGVGLVLALGSGLFWLLRPRGGDEDVESPVEHDVSP